MSDRDLTSPLDFYNNDNKRFRGIWMLEHKKYKGFMLILVVIRRVVQESLRK